MNTRKIGRVPNIGLLALSFLFVLGCNDIASKAEKALSRVVLGKRLQNIYQTVQQGLQDSHRRQPPSSPAHKYSLLETDTDDEMMSTKMVADEVTSLNDECKVYDYFCEGMMDLKMFQGLAPLNENESYKGATVTEIMDDGTLVVHMEDDMENKKMPIKVKMIQKGGGLNVKVMLDKMSMSSGDMTDSMNLYWYFQKTNGSSIFSGQLTADSIQVSISFMVPSDYTSAAGGKYNGMPYVVATMKQQDITIVEDWGSFLLTERSSGKDTNWRIMLSAMHKDTRLENKQQPFASLDYAQATFNSESGEWEFDEDTIKTEEKAASDDLWSMTEAPSTLADEKWVEEIYAGFKLLVNDHSSDYDEELKTKLIEHRKLAELKAKLGVK